MKKPSASAGFTLVELIVVIVLIGILAAVAIPRFINQTSNARKASLSGLQGAINSAVILAEAEYRAEGNTATTANVATITMDNISVAVVPGTGAPSASSGGIGTALNNFSGFVLGTPAAQVVPFTFTTNQPNCSLTYADSSAGATVASTVQPIATLVTTGC